MNKKNLGVILIQDMVLFPNSEVRIESENTEDKEIIKLVDASEDKLMLVVNPIMEEDSKDITTLPKIGVLAELKLRMDVPNGKTRIILRGIKRVEVENYSNIDSRYEADVKDININHTDEDHIYSNLLINSLEDYIASVPYMSNAVVNKISTCNNLDELTDLIAGFLPVSYEKKKRYIVETSPIVRAKLLIGDMAEDLKVIELEKKIDTEVEKELNESQKEFYLREKIRVIKKELGDVNSKEDEVTLLREKLKKLKCSPKVKEKIKKEISRYETTSANSPELGMIRDYLDWMLNLPWNKCTKDISDLSQVEYTLNSSHYGLEDVKLRILEYLAVKQNTNNLRSPILCLVGPPGVGKTSLALSIANSRNRKVAKISVGGMNDEAEIIGHRRT